MSRDASYQFHAFRTAAATAGTTTDLSKMTPCVFLFEGWEWMYEAAEANTDNTVTVKIEYTVDGTNYTTLKAVNANAAGLLDSAAPLVPLRNPANPASGGAAWAAESNPANVRVPINASFKCTFVTAGTGTIPAQDVLIYGKNLATITTDAPTANVG